MTATHPSPASEANALYNANVTASSADLATVPINAAADQETSTMVHISMPQQQRGGWARPAPAAPPSRGPWLSTTMTTDPFNRERDRQRNVLLRSLSQLQKNDASPRVPKPTCHDEELQAQRGESGRPFHHSELAQPPLYSIKNTATIRSRLSLDVRRPRIPFGASEEDDNADANDSSASRWRRAVRRNRSQCDLRDMAHDQPSSSRISTWRRKGLSLFHLGSSKGAGFARKTSRSPSSSREAPQEWQNVDHALVANDDSYRSNGGSTAIPHVTCISPTRSTRESSEGQVSLFDSNRSFQRTSGSPASSLAAIQDTVNLEQLAERQTIASMVKREDDHPTSAVSTNSISSGGGAGPVSTNNVRTSSDDLTDGNQTASSTTVITPKAAAAATKQRSSVAQPEPLAIDGGGGRWNPNFDIAHPTTNGRRSGEAILSSTSPIVERQAVVQAASEERAEGGQGRMSATTAVQTAGMASKEHAAARQQLSLPLHSAVLALGQPSSADCSAPPPKVGLATGLDEEQDALDRANSISLYQSDNHTSATMAATGTANQSNDNSSSRRPMRSSKLSQLPRLNSSRGPTVGGGGIGGGGPNNADDGSDDEGQNPQRRTDTPSDDESAEQETEDGEGSESESDDDGTMSMPGSLPMSLGGRTSSGFSSVEGRQSRRPSGIVLPPAPNFVQIHENDVSPTSSASAIASTSAVPIGGQAQENASLDGSFATPTLSGRASWTQFSHDDTPSWLPTPKASAGPVPSSAQMPPPPVPSHASGRHAAVTPLSTLNTDMSYFAITPVAQSPQTSLRDQNEANIPPPSPSIITRSRAQSSASSRPMRTPTLPGRELPAMPPIEPLKLRSVERSRSPAASASNKKAVPPPLIPPPPFGRTNTSTQSQSSSKDLSIVSPYPTIRTPPKSAASARPSTSTAAVTAGVSSATSPSLRPVSQIQAAGNSGGLSVPAIVGSNRPSLYKQESRSLIDLTSPSRKQLEPTLMPLQRREGLIAELPESATAAVTEPKVIRTPSPAPSSTSIPTSLPPRRRRSMYEVGAAPPPYSSIHSGAFANSKMIVPREEEGQEFLPQYGCSVHIEGYLPRKMEFSSPGVQAKDRSWRKQYFVLHGTCLRVYRTDLSSDRGAVKGAYGAMDGPHVHLEPLNEDGPISASAAIADSGFANGQANASGRRNSTRVQGVDASVEASKELAERSTTAAAIATPRSSPAQSTHSTGGGGGGGGGLQKTVEAALSGTISHINHPFSLHRTSLVKQYSLQGAESGLAADYLKRRHVVRVRAEGEQFLLQTRNDRHVVDWIEAFQAATNIALDLERRPMPKFITLPRRRRRRRREGEQTVAGAGTTARASSTSAPDGSTAAAREAADLAEARRRSLADAGISASSSTGRGSISGSASRANPPRPLGLPGDESPPNPSAAFEEMLREEHEGMAQRDAGDV